MTGTPIPESPDDPAFQGKRALYLTDWNTLVQPHYDKAENMVAHSVTYGSGALNASYLINGGALATLPAFLTIFTQAKPDDIAWVAVPFVGALVATAVSSTAAYLNFQFIAKVYWHDGQHQIAQLYRFYALGNLADPPQAERDAWETRVQISFKIGLGAGLVALLFFLWGCWGFYDLARRSPTAENPTQKSHPI